MEKKTECEIVQDLLISYVDGVLNKESKKLVESHLLDCKKCQERVAEIKAETEKEKDEQRKEIDYLKKIRIKSRIKSVLLAILILGIIFVSWYLYKFCILNSIAKKAEKQFEGDNFYTETISSCDEDTISYTKTWYKDGKYKVVRYTEKEEGIEQYFETQYGNISENPKEEYWVDEERKQVRIEKKMFEQQKEEFICSPTPFYMKYVKRYGYQYILMKLGTPFYAKISTDHKEIGRKYYILDSGETKKWVDMDTGLPIMSFGDVIGTTYYKDTKIPKQKFESVSEYRYEFETVTDEDVEMPNLEGYEIQEFDWQEEVNRALEEQKD